MPSLPFVLPHWLYWGTLIVFPIVAIYFVAAPAPARRAARARRSSSPTCSGSAPASWACIGSICRNNWGFVFIPVFLLILHTTDVIRDQREDVSRTRAAVGAAVSELDHAKIPPGVTATPQMQERLAKAEAAEPKAKSDFEAAQADLDALARLFALARDPDGRDAGRSTRSCCLAWCAGRRSARPRSAPTRRPRSCAPDVPQIGTHEDPTLAYAYALHRRDRMGEHPRRRVRRLLGGDLGVRLLLRGDRALRVQLADQLAAREHVPDVRHAVHDRRRLCLSVRPACARRRVLRKILDARQSHRRHHHLGVLLHLRPHAAVHQLALRHGLVQSRRHRRSLLHRMGRAVLAGEADDADRRRAAAAAGLPNSSKTSSS